MQQGSVNPSKFQTQRQGNLNKNPIASKLKYVSIALLQSPFPNLTIYTIVLFAIVKIIDYALSLS
jgi:hypothetical protein